MDEMDCTYGFMDNVFRLTQEEYDALKENGMLREITPMYDELYMLSDKAIAFLEKNECNNQ